MKLKWGALVVDGRAKIGGHVASKNRGGAYLRTKVTPVNPQTTSQSAVRSIFTAVAQAWRDLTAAQRASFNAAVENFKRTDVFGDLKTPSGSQLHQRLNINLVNIGEPVITEAPLPIAVPSMDTLSATAAAAVPALSVVFTPTPIPANSVAVVEATAQLSPGRYFVKNQFRKIGQIAAAGTSPFNALAAYTAKFGTLVEGQKIGIRVKIVDMSTGLTSQYLSTSLIVAA